MAQSPAPGENHSVHEYAKFYDAEYYRCGFGEEAYERNTHWPEFFARIAEELIRSLKPESVFDAGCAWGFLVEAFWDRGVEARGVDISEYAIRNVRLDMQPYCRVGSVSTPLDREYDLITCIEVLEHIPADEADEAIANLCRFGKRILFSSTPRDLEEESHINVRPVAGWLRSFQKHGFVPDLIYNASFVAPHAILLRPQKEPMGPDVMALFNETVQGRVELVERLKRLIQAARDIQELRTAAEEAARERDRAGEVDLTVEEWIRHNADLQRQMRKAEDEAGARLHDAWQQLETARRQQEETAEKLQQVLRESSETRAYLEHERDQAAAYGREAAQSLQDMSARLHVMTERHLEVELLASHIQAEYASPAWKLIKRYRNWMDGARQRHPVLRKMVDKAVVRTLRTLRAAPAAHPAPAPEPASAPAPAGPQTAATPARGIAGAAPRPTPGATAAEYAEWIRENEPDAAGLALQARIAGGLAYRPTISVVTPVYKVPLDVVREMVVSVQAQSYDNWELCIAHAFPEATDVRQYLEELSAADSRIRVRLLPENLGIARNSNSALELASGEFIALLDHDDTLAPFALFEAVRALNEDSSIDFIYSDKDQLAVEGGVERRIAPLFKPHWSPEIMISANYLTHLCIMRSEVVHAAGGWQQETDGAQDWDLFLRVIARSRRVHHIPKILYHWRQIATSVAARGFDAKPYAARAQATTLEHYCQTRGWDADVQPPNGAGDVRIVWRRDPAQKISIVYIPTAGGAAAVAAVTALLEASEIPNVEVLVPVTDETPSSDARVKTVIAEDADLATRIARAVDRASGEYLVFLDEAVRPSGPGWAEELIGPLQNPEVGIVGAKLLQPDAECVRHAGLVFDRDGRLQYIFSGEPEYYYELFGGPGWYRNWTAVSGACFAMRRQTWQDAGGLAGTIAYPRLDVELCLRVQFQLGLRVAYNPYARFFQQRTSALEAWLGLDAESAAAGYIVSSFPAGDPYFNLNLSCAKGSVRLDREKKGAAKLDYAAEARILVQAFDFTRAQLEQSKRVNRSAGKSSLKTITWILPEFANPFYGGVHTILRFAAQFSAAHGVRNTFAILGRANPASMRQRIGAAFPALAAASDVQVVGSDEALNELPASDAAVATLWTTAYSLLKFRNTRRKFYFIQDYEPLFYPAGSTSALVEATYGFGFLGICNTVSLRDLYVAQGGRAEYFDPCIDPSTFYLGEGRDGRKPRLLFCYARPGHARNCFELLMAALGIVKTRMRDDVTIVTAGADWRPEAYGLEGVIRNLGLLGYRETGALYRACDAGLVAMETRHPSYLPLEMMACGCAVVTNRNPSTGWLLRDRENCLVSEAGPSAMAEALEEVLRHQPLRAQLAEGGAETASRYSAWDAQAEKIFHFMVAEC
jgi:O-antigen biosynthesis protein